MSGGEPSTDLDGAADALSHAVGECGQILLDEVGRGGVPDVKDILLQSTEHPVLAKPKRKYEGRGAGGP